MTEVATLHRQTFLGDTLERFLPALGLSHVGQNGGEVELNHRLTSLPLLFTLDH